MEWDRQGVIFSIIWSRSECASWTTAGEMTCVRLFPSVGFTLTEPCKNLFPHSRMQLSWLNALPSKLREICCARKGDLYIWYRLYIIIYNNIICLSLSLFLTLTLFLFLSLRPSPSISFSNTICLPLTQAIFSFSGSLPHSHFSKLSSELPYSPMLV